MHAPTTFNEVLPCAISTHAVAARGVYGWAMAAHGPGMEFMGAHGKVFDGYGICAHAMGAYVVAVYGP